MGGIPINHPPTDNREPDAVSGVLSSGRLTDPSRNGGGYVRLFEESIRGFTGARHVVAVSSGTSALPASLAAPGVGRGSEIKNTPNTIPRPKNTTPRRPSPDEPPRIPAQSPPRIPRAGHTSESLPVTQRLSYFH